MEAQTALIWTANRPDLACLATVLSTANGQTGKSGTPAPLPVALVQSNVFARRQRPDSMVHHVKDKIMRHRRAHKHLAPLIANGKIGVIGLGATLHVDTVSWCALVARQSPSKVERHVMDLTKRAKHAPKPHAQEETAPTQHRQQNWKSWQAVRIQ